MNMLLVHLASVAVLAIAVECACRLGRFRPAICHALWLVVLVKLVVPPVVGWPVEPERIVAAFSASGVPGMVVSGPLHKTVARGSFVDGAPVVEPGNDEIAAGGERTAAFIGPLAGVVAGGIWLLGGVVIAVRIIWEAWLLLAAGVVWWWNPCFWWVRNRVHLFSEMACDAWVVNVHPGDRKQYAETMVRIMAMLSKQDAPAT